MLDQNNATPCTSCIILDCPMITPDVKLSISSMGSSMTMVSKVRFMTCSCLQCFAKGIKHCRVALVDRPHGPQGKIEPSPNSFKCGNASATSQSNTLSTSSQETNTLINKDSICENSINGLSVDAVMI